MKWLLALLSLADATELPKPNILFVLTDDQDMALGGLTPMVKLKKLVIDEGTLFKNAFVTTPICCPSRSSILTGKYIHNHGAHNNSVEGNCAGVDWLANNEKRTMATHLKSLGYRTMFAGKYLNQYGTRGSPSEVSHVPPGWDSWLGKWAPSVASAYSVLDSNIV
jgi:N-acetylglucosamine-6-sulfatase